MVLRMKADRCLALHSTKPVFFRTKTETKKQSKSPGEKSLIQFRAQNFTGLRFFWLDVSPPSAKYK